MLLKVSSKEVKRLGSEIKNNDIKGILESNLFVFKENVKVLFNFTMDKVLDDIIKPDNLNQLILKEMHQGEFNEIEELEEERNMSNTNSLILGTVGLLDHIQ